jgi:hypothetical protein
VAIVHVAFKSSSQAPPAAAHAQYISREGRYERRGGVELAESGNMPEFARDDPHAFWAAADARERANGRAYTEVQIALPRELGREDRHELARQAARELLGDRFAYTLAVHVPVAKDNLDQPHLHLMFSERVIDETTRALPEERFFKRNGAKKDPAWNARTKPEEVREKWVEMMNGAMERAGLDQRLDARSWAGQGREDLAQLVEPKLLGGENPDAQERRSQVEQLRRERAELPAPHLDRAAAAVELEKRAEAEVARIERRRDREVGILDKLIEKARALAVEARDRATAFAHTVAERVESLFGGKNEKQIEAGAPARETARPPTPVSMERPIEKEIEARLDASLADLDRRLAIQESIDESMDARLEGLDRRMDADELARIESEQRRQPEIAPERGVRAGKEIDLDMDLDIDLGRGRGMGW